MLLTPPQAPPSTQAVTPLTQPTAFLWLHPACLSYSITALEIRTFILILCRLNTPLCFIVFPCLLDHLSIHYHLDFYRKISNSLCCSSSVFVFLLFTQGKNPEFLFHLDLQNLKENQPSPLILLSQAILPVQMLPCFSFLSLSASALPQTDSPVVIHL